MAERKQTVDRPYPPDYASAENSCLPSRLFTLTIDTYVRDGFFAQT
jgi:hypothetical protein